MSGAAAAQGGMAAQRGPLTRPQLAKRACHSATPQKPHWPAAKPGGVRRPAAVTSCEERLAAAPGEGSVATAVADGNRTTALQLPTKPSLTNRRSAALIEAGPSVAACSAVTGEPTTCGVHSASVTLPMLPGPPAKVSFARKKSVAAKPTMTKRPMSKSKTPALETILEDAAAGAAPSSLQLAAPVTLAAGAEPAATVETAAAKPALRQRTKAADLDIDAVHDKVVQKHAEGKLTDLTVPEAKCWLKSRKLKLKGNKEELVARILENFLPK